MKQKETHEEDSKGDKTRVKRAAADNERETLQERDDAVEQQDGRKTTDIRSRTRENSSSELSRAKYNRVLHLTPGTVRYVFLTNFLTSCGNLQRSISGRFCVEF